MRTTSLSATPVFPEWVFRGKLTLDQNTLNAVIAEVNSLPRFDRWFGFATQENALGNATNAFARLVGNLFYTEAQYHFRLSEEEHQRINICGNRFYSVNPNYKTDREVTYQRWYRGVVKLSGDEVSSNLRFNMMNEKFFTNPPAAQDREEIFEMKPLEVIYFPAHIPWDMTVNQSRTPCMFFTTEFHMIHPKS